MYFLSKLFSKNFKDVTEIDFYSSFNDTFFDSTPIMSTTSI